VTAKHEVCPQCKGKQCVVVNSRPHPTKRVRQRRCRGCKATWNTYESLLDPDDLPQKMVRERFAANN
jgi:transcriptional regulator NrdR family protein